MIALWLSTFASLCASFARLSIQAPQYALYSEPILKQKKSFGNYVSSLEGASKLQAKVPGKGYASLLIQTSRRILGCPATLWKILVSKQSHFISIDATRRARRYVAKGYAGTGSKGMEGGSKFSKGRR